MPAFSELENRSKGCEPACAGVFVMIRVDFARVKNKMNRAIIVVREERQLVLTTI
jgi:hypothetical protein